MGPTVIDTNPATVSSSSFLTTGIWTKLQGKERFSYLFLHSLGLGLHTYHFSTDFKRGVSSWYQLVSKFGMYLSYFSSLN